MEHIEKKFPAGLEQCKIPGCNQYLDHMCKCEFMQILTLVEMALLKPCFDCLGKEYRKEERSEDSNKTRVLLSTDIDSMINSNSLEQIQGVNARSVLLSVEACSLIIPVSLKIPMKEKKREMKIQTHQVWR